MNEKYIMVRDKIKGDLYEVPEGSTYDTLRFEEIKNDLGPIGSTEDDSYTRARDKMRDIGEVKSTDLGSKLMEAIGGLGVGSVAGGMLGGALGTAAVPFTGPVGPYGGAVGGAAIGQMLEDYLRKGEIDKMQTMLAGVGGIAGPIGGKIAAGMWPILRGTGSIALRQDAISRLARLAAGAGLGYHGFSQHPLLAAAGASAPYIGSALTGLYKIGNWNPFAVAAATGGAEELINQYLHAPQGGGQNAP